MAHKSLLKALSAEQQAIAIYSAEIALFKMCGRSYEVFSQVLTEEREHEGHIASYLKDHSLGKSNPVSSLANKLAGAALGTFLALLPSRLRNRIHVWAENEAAEIYLSCAETIACWQNDVPHSADLIQSLRLSADQETRHALRFKQLNS